MRSVLLWLLVCLPVSFAATAETAPDTTPDYKEGEAYIRLASPQPTNTGENIEVVELFWYGCPHCFDLEPEINAWLEGKPDDVEFVRIPAILGARWELLARAYFTADLLDVEERIHEPLFEAIHDKKRRFKDEDSVAAFFVEQGVPIEDFTSTFNSFAVATRVNNAKLMTRRYQIDGVPTLVINGKYRTTGRLAGGNTQMIQVMEYLVDQERGDRDSEASATVAQ